MELLKVTVALRGRRSCNGVLGAGVSSNICIQQLYVGAGGLTLALWEQGHHGNQQMLQLGAICWFVWGASVYAFASTPATSEPPGERMHWERMGPAGSPLFPHLLPSVHPLLALPASWPILQQASCAPASVSCSCCSSTKQLQAHLSDLLQGFAEICLLSKTSLNCASLPNAPRHPAWAFSVAFDTISLIVPFTDLFFLFSASFPLCQNASTKGQGHLHLFFYPFIPSPYSHAWHTKWLLPFVECMHE